MEIRIDVPNYDPWEGIRISWVDGYEIEAGLEDNGVTIWANKEGLLTLATQMLTLAQDGIPVGHHIHLTNDSGLDERSLDLLIGKK